MTPSSMPAGTHARSVTVFQTLARRWYLLHCTVLLGYALLSRGFAYLGIGGVFVGDITLGLGLMVCCLVPSWRAVFRCTLVQVLIGFDILALFHTVPYVGRYGVDAIRDSALWGYSGYSLIMIPLLLNEPSLLGRYLRAYAKFVDIFLLAAPLVWLLFFVGNEHIPVWPASGVPILYAKSGDTLVHVAGILGFLNMSLTTKKGWTPYLIVVNLGLAASTSRGGLLAFLVSGIVLVSFGGIGKVLRTTVIVSVVVLGVGLLVNSELPIWYQGRPVSAEQIFRNVEGIFGSSDDQGGLDDTKMWRMDWWNSIWQYTVNGPYFWNGKGYGVNLADDDGFQVQSDDSLRSPHNSHLTFLARSGVPGLTAWLVLQFFWLGRLVRCCLAARKRRLAVWSNTFLWLICYWIAFMVNACFDPALEGPMSGIWFWSVFGLGIGGSLLYETISADQIGCHEAVPIIHDR